MRKHTPLSMGNWSHGHIQVAAARARASRATIPAIWRRNATLPLCLLAMCGDMLGGKGGRSDEEVAARRAAD